MIRRQLAIFAAVGTLTVLIDFLAYRGLVWMDLFGIDVSKAIGFLTGSVFAYFINRSWTFRHKANLPGSALRFVVLYAATLGTNVFVNSLILDRLIGTFLVMEVAFIIATGLSAILNFIGMKLFVFKSRSA